MYTKQVKWKVNHISVAYSLSNICTKHAGIGQLLLKLSLVVGWYVLWDTVYNTIITCFYVKNVPFGEHVNKLLLTILGGQIPTAILGLIGDFKPNTWTIQTFILSKLLHGFQPNFA